MKEKVRQRKPATYKSPESRARQLAGLQHVVPSDHVPGTDIQNVTQQGPFATVTEEMRRHIIELYMQGNNTTAVVAKTGYSAGTVDAIKASALDCDSQFREAYYKHNLKAKLQRVAESSLDRLTELMPTLTGRDAAITAGVTIDKLVAIDRTAPDTLHQHVHIHGAQDISKMFNDALKPKS